MATRKVQLGVTVGVPDPSASVPEMRDAEGRVISAANINVRYVPAGEEVELESVEADSLEARFPYRPPVAVQPAGTVPVKSVR